MKRSSGLVAVVVGVHVALVASVALMQGCRTTGPAVPPDKDAAVVMPPTLRPPPESPVHLVPPEPGERPAFTQWPPPDPRAVPSETHATTYVVQPGDSISKIAARHGLRAAELTALNRIADPNRIRVGQKLQLPGKVDVPPAPQARPAAQPAARPAAQPAAAPAPLAGRVNVVVQPNDSLWKIAHQHGSTVAAIREANNLKSDTVRPGQKLTVPVRGEPPAGKTPAVAPAAVRPPTPAPMPAPVALPEGDDEPAPEGPATIAPAASAAPTADGPARWHTATENQDLNSIAMLYNVSLERLRKLNDLADTKLQPGQRVLVPLDE